MSLVGVITVRKCDECQEPIVIKTASEHIDFNDNWHTGYSHDFCPECRDTVKVQARIIDDELIDKVVTRAISKYRGRVGGFAHVS